MATVLYLPEAKDDLFEIWRYHFEQTGSVELADRFIDRIDDTALLFATQPESGSPRPDLAPALRAFPVGDYVVFYLPQSEGVEIVQIIHGSRDIPRRFRSPN